MKYQDEYRKSDVVKELAEKIHQITTKNWKIMEVCGGQTHSIVRHGIDKLIPEHIELIHGPGCPVCVTPIEVIDRAIDIASQDNVILCTFGDMLRVPGNNGDLFAARAAGADVKVVYSIQDAIRTAEQTPDREIVFFAVGFETTAPTTAHAALLADQKKLKNFTLLISHVLVPPAIEAVMSSKDNTVQGFLAAGHVCSIMGTAEYLPLVEKYRVPIVVTGFEPVDILQGILMCVKQLENGEYRVENQYSRVVKNSGNPSAVGLIRKVFQTCEQSWRGLGKISSSGLSFKPEYSHLDADTRFPELIQSGPANTDCKCGEILKGLLKPYNCPHFGNNCTPDNPLGATMVSSEGACAAYYRYRHDTEGDSI